MDIDWVDIILICFLASVIGLSLIYFFGSVDLNYCDGLCELRNLESFIK